MLKMDYAEYRPRFGEILRRLEAVVIWDTLHSMTFDAEPVLLCFERPPLTAENWCHRRMVAEWFETEMGVIVPEWEPPTPEQQRSPAAQRLFDLGAPGQAEPS